MPPPPPAPPAPPPAPMAPPAPTGPSKKSGGKSASADRGALLSSIQHGARLKKTVTNDRSSPQVGGNKPAANKFNTVAGRPTSSGDRNLPPAWRGSRDDANTGGVQPPAGPVGLGGLFGGGIPTLPKNRNKQRTGQRPPGSAPAMRPPNSSNGPVSVGMNNFNNNHMVNGPDIKGRPGPPPPPPSTNKPKTDFPNTGVNKNGHVSNGGTHDSISDRIGLLHRSSQDFTAGIPRGNPPPPPNRQPPAVVKPTRNSSTGQLNNLPNNRPPSVSMVGRPLPPPPMPAQQPQPPTSRPPSIGMSAPPQPPATKPPPPPVRVQPPPVNVSNIRSGHAPPPPPAPPQRTTSNMPGGTIGRSGRMPPPPPVRSQATGISGPPSHGPPPPPVRKSGHYSGGFDDFEAKYKFHEMNELPPPEPFGNINKSYPTQNKRSQGSRRAPPPPPPQ